MTGAEVGALLVLFGVAPIGSWFMISGLVALFIPADPANLPRIGVWLQGQLGSSEDSSLPPLIHHVWWGGLGLFTFLIMQGVDVRALADPNQSAAWADVKIAVVLVEAALLIWTVWLVATFWRARSRSR